MPSKTLLTLTLLLTPALVSAAFVPLVGIPGIDAEASFNDYINALYALSISIAALIAVIKIIIAGVKWMLSDVASSKQEAKSDIEGALLGLLLIIAAVLILEVINPQLKSSSLFLGKVDTVTRAPAPNNETAPRLKDWEFHKDLCPDINTNTKQCQDLKAHCARDNGKVVDETNRIMCIIETPIGGGAGPMNPGEGSGGEGDPNISAVSSAPKTVGAVTITTMAAVKVEKTSAQLQASIKPGTLSSWTIYGTELDNLNQRSSVRINYSDANSAAKIHDSWTSYDIPLVPNTVYYYEICTSSGTAGIICGNPMKFKTLP